MNEPLEVETLPAPTCPICGSAGGVLYRDLPDKLFGASGVWTFKYCETCDGLWLDPIPGDLRRSYQFYHTHLDPVDANTGSNLGKMLRAAYKPIKSGYLRVRFKYGNGVGPSWWSIFAPLAFFHPAGTDAIAGDAMFLPAPKPGAQLLEIGCGNGLTLEKMRERGWQVEGVEFDPECAVRVEARGLKCHSRDLRELALPANSFDAIYMGHVIEHLHDPRSLLKECGRVLKSGGRLVMVTPNSRSWGHKHYGQDWRGLEAPRHLQIFSPRSLSQLAQASGFNRCEVRTTNRSAWYALGMSAAGRKARRNGHSSLKTISIVSWRALAFEIFGRALHFFRPDASEEIILTARKP